MKKSILQKELTLLSLYVSTDRLSNNLKLLPIDMKESNDSNTIISRDLNVPLSILVNHLDIKINKETMAIKEEIKDQGIADIYEAFPSPQN